MLVKREEEGERTLLQEVATRRERQTVRRYVLGSRNKGEIRETYIVLVWRKKETDRT